MITNHDRSGWFGASDTATIMRGWETASFRAWWLEKTGICAADYHSWAMDVGNIMEIPIIEAIERAEGRRIQKGKHPLYKPNLRLRVNFDGLTPQSVVEIKTTGQGFKKPPLSYWQQAQVLMLATRRPVCELYAYHLADDDYTAPYFPEIDMERMKRFEIPYDPEWIRMKYTPRLKFLARCLRRRVIPDAAQFNREVRGA